MNNDLSELFSMIYYFQLWGIDENTRFYSGPGSRDSCYVDEYVNSVSEFLNSFSNPPTVLDVGCGDFFVGNKIRNKCGKYIACDIVPELIEYNKEKYKNCDIDFRVLDITSNDLPNADVVIIRQVFQHLSNEDILKSIPKITNNNFKYLIFTDEVPSKQFKCVPNLNIESGIGTRLCITGGEFRPEYSSGVVLTESPFNLPILEEKILCEDRRTKTILYKLKS